MFILAKRSILSAPLFFNSPNPTIVMQAFLWLHARGPMSTSPPNVSNELITHPNYKRLFLCRIYAECSPHQCNSAILSTMNRFGYHKFLQRAYLESTSELFLEFLSFKIWFCLAHFWIFPLGNIRLEIIRY